MNEQDIAYRKYLIISKIAGVQIPIEETPNNVQKVVDEMNRKFWVEDFKAIRQPSKHNARSEQYIGIAIRRLYLKAVFIFLHNSDSQTES